MNKHNWGSLFIAFSILLIAGFAGAQINAASSITFSGTGSSDPDLKINRGVASDLAEFQFTFGTSDVVEYTMKPDTIVVEGATADAFEATMAWTDPTADVTHTWPDASVTAGQLQVNCTALAVADMVDQSCWISDGVYTVTAIDMVWTTAESAGTLTVIARKQEGTEAPASGQALNTAVNVVATAETTTAATLTATGADLIFADGDRLGIDFTDDVAGELAGLVVTVHLIPG